MKNCNKPEEDIIYLPNKLEKNLTDIGSYRYKNSSSSCPSFVEQYSNDTSKNNLQKYSLHYPSGNYLFLKRKKNFIDRNKDAKTNDDYNLRQNRTIQIRNQLFQKDHCFVNSFF